MINLLSTILYLLLGFAAGYFIQKDKLTETTQAIKRKIDVKASPVGVVRRPTAQDLLKRTDPLEIKKEEGVQEMRKTLENIKELK